MEEYNLEKIFHLDSDCILFKDINEYPFTSEVAYQYGLNSKSTDMADSIHNSLLNINFCNEFEKLYEKIYIEKDISLIKDKINYHYNKFLNIYTRGGICDMTFYYILRKNKIIDVQDLGKPVVINGKESVFINNINNGEGPENKNQYKLKFPFFNTTIDIKKGENKNDYYIYDNINKKNINILNIHYQGSSKKFLNKDLKKSIEENREIENKNIYQALYFLLLIFLLILVLFLIKKYILV